MYKIKNKICQTKNKFNMQIQSLSIVVPGGCPNNCPCCVSKLHTDIDSYKNQLEDNYQFEALYSADFKDALEFARDNGCNAMMFTGDGEPLMNKNFMRKVAELNRQLKNPFLWNEIQTTGVFLLDKGNNGGEKNLRWLRDYMRIKMISLSVFNPFDSDENAKCTRPKNAKAYVDVEATCAAIRKYNFGLRLSLNLYDYYDGIAPVTIFNRAKELGANQITFRVLYNIDNPKTSAEKGINDWIIENKCAEETVWLINSYIRDNGRPLERLPFGAIRYSVHGMSCVVDDDCMSSKTEEIKDQVKYLILRPDCKLYTRWDDEGSMLF
jgi:hypothetical protein